MVFDRDFSQLVKTLGKIFFLETREYLYLLGIGNKKNLLESFRGVRSCFFQFLMLKMSRIWGWNDGEMILVNRLECFHSLWRSCEVFLIW